jgi:hypothetical protein
MKRGRCVGACCFEGAFAMVLSPQAPAYILFCDESGDPGLKNNASDWFIVSAVLVSVSNEPKAPEWIRRIKKPMRSQRKVELHFHRLNPSMRYRASRMLGKLPVRCFAIVSHKTNMVGYSNPRVERRHAWRDYAPDGTWTVKPRNSFFHNWLLKVLLERVTQYVGARSRREHGRPRTVRIVIAKRGGFNLAEFKAYLYDSRIKSTAGKTLLPGDLDWSVVELNEISIAPAANLAGLQLADIVAGAFSNAVDHGRFGACDLRYAQNLAGRMTLNPRSGRTTDFGVMAWPRPLRKAKLKSEQVGIFRFYGYDEYWLVGPGPRPAGR